MPSEGALKKLIDISSHSDADDKFDISQLLDLAGWVFEDEKQSTLEATRSIILHEAAALGQAKAQFILSLDYQQGINGFQENSHLAELWRQKACSMVRFTPRFHQTADHLVNVR
ncbi:MAG: hypothetical protein QMC17_08085 [Paracoccaceae bacterium]|jgi:hypothetical protein